MSFEQLRKQVEDFWNKTYAAYTPSDRKAYWIAQLGKGVSWERSQGADPYALFTPEAHAAWLEQEPQLDDYWEDICAALELDVDVVRRCCAGE
jgi:hypothetical protein